MTNAVDVGVGANLRRRRQAIGMDREKLAEHSGLGLGMLEQIEDGTVRASVDHLKALTDVLGMKAEDIYAGIADGMLTGSRPARLVAE